MDVIDRAQREEEEWLAQAVAAARGAIPPGRPGDCDLCGEHSSRLVEGACAPCRERYLERRVRGW